MIHLNIGDKVIIDNDRYLIELPDDEDSVYLYLRPIDIE